MAPRSVITPTKLPEDRVDKGTISIVNGAMILIFFLAQVGLGAIEWKGMVDRQDSSELRQTKDEADRKEDHEAIAQCLELLQTIKPTIQDHTEDMKNIDRKLDAVTTSIQGMKNRSDIMYADRFGTYDNYLAWKNFVDNNPSLHLSPPDIYGIRKDNPPINPPFQ